MVRAVLDDCPIVFFVLDSTGQFIVSEGRGLERFGLEAGQIVGATVQELYRNSHPEYIQDFLKCLYEDGEFWSSTYIETPKGIFAYKTLYKRIETDGEPMVLGIAFDYTDEQALIKHLNTELEASNVLTKELTQNINTKEKILTTFSRKKLFATAKILYAIFGGIALVYQILRILDFLKPL